MLVRSPVRRFTPRRRADSGYTLLMLAFTMALMFIAAAAAAPSILTQGRREKEKELIWRGEQYARAVRLYYRKTGRFPASLEDLTKDFNGIHFMRKAYKDPMNPPEGSWRLLRLGPGGQIVGSDREGATVNLGGLGKPVGQQGAAGEGVQGGQPGGSQAPGGIQPAVPQSGGSSGSGFDSNLGVGPVIGVASQNPRRSIIVYRDGETYRRWEFVYDPSRDQSLAPAGQQGAPAQPQSPATQPQRPTRN